MLCQVRSRSRVRQEPGQPHLQADLTERGRLLRGSSRILTLLSAKLRRKRFRLFETLLSQLQEPIHILDVGGTQSSWDLMSLSPTSAVSVTLLNLRHESVSLPNFSSVIGDARDMTSFADARFDVVFSNSVIEHVGGFEDQRRMAREVQRVGKRYFVQTPNRHFPIEPHFLFPFFQFLPVQARVRLVRHFALGWYPRAPDNESARRMVEEIRLLTKQELLTLFPGASVFEENFLGMTKSFTFYCGWH